MRRKPYSVVLLDEVEKAHTDVMELFFQVFDKGMMEDGEGRRIDFKNCLIILTSNLGTDLIMNLCADEETMPDPAGMGEMVKPELLKHFKPAFLGRMKIVPYYPITDENMKLIIRLKLNRIVKRMKEHRDVDFIYDDAIVEAIASRCTDVDSGARNADNIMTNTLLPECPGTAGQASQGEQIKRVTVSMMARGSLTTLPNRYSNTGFTPGDHSSRFGGEGNAHGRVRSSVQGIRQVDRRLLTGSAPWGDRRLPDLRQAALFHQQVSGRICSDWRCKSAMLDRGDGRPSPGGGSGDRCATS